MAGPMKPAGKPGLMIALGMGGAKKPASASGPGDAVEPDADDTGDDFDAAAHAAFDALQEQDVDGFKAALKAAVMACQDTDYSES